MQKLTSTWPTNSALPLDMRYARPTFLTVPYTKKLRSRTRYKLRELARSRVRCKTARVVLRARAEKRRTYVRSALGFGGFLSVLILDPARLASHAFKLIRRIGSALFGRAPAAVEEPVQDAANVPANNPVLDEVHQRALHLADGIIENVRPWVDAAAQYVPMPPRIIGGYGDVARQFFLDRFAVFLSPDENARRLLLADDDGGALFAMLNLEQGRFDLQQFNPAEYHGFELLLRRLLGWFARNGEILLQANIGPDLVVALCHALIVVMAVVAYMAYTARLWGRPNWPIGPILIISTVLTALGGVYHFLQPEALQLLARALMALRDQGNHDLIHNIMHQPEPEHQLNELGRRLVELVEPPAAQPEVVNVPSPESATPNRLESTPEPMTHWHFPDGEIVHFIRPLNLPPQEALQVVGVEQSASSSVAIVQSQPHIFDDVVIMNDGILEGYMHELDLQDEYMHMYENDINFPVELSPDDANIIIEQIDDPIQPEDDPDEEFWQLLMEDVEPPQPEAPEHRAVSYDGPDDDELPRRPNFGYYSAIAVFVGVVVVILTGGGGSSWGA